MSKYGRKDNKKTGKRRVRMEGNGELESREMENKKGGKRRVRMEGNRLKEERK